MNPKYLFCNFFKNAGSVERWEITYFARMVFICTGASKSDPAFLLGKISTKCLLHDS